MSIPVLPVPQSAAEEALRWFLRLRDPGCSDDERRIFEQWLAADVGHQAEFTSVLETWNRLALVAAAPDHELAQCVAQALAIRASRDGSPRRRGLRLGRLAAVAAVIVLTSGTLWWWLFVKVTATDYRTGRGEQQTVTLPDGTIMELNAGTVVTTRFWGWGRQVIIESGDVYVTVAPDARRPFEVVAAMGRIQDIGTQFAVSKKAHRVTVAVETGAVRIDLPAPQTMLSEMHRLHAGEQGIYTAGGRWIAAERVEAQHVAIWRQGRVLFDAIPLAEAIDEISRYWPGQILLADPAVGTIRVRGVFNSRHLEEFFTALPTIVPVEVTHRFGDIIISRR